jgi:hypothetical protein
MKTRRLIKKYRNKSKNKSRKRILKGGVPKKSNVISVTRKQNSSSRAPSASRARSASRAPSASRARSASRAPSASRVPRSSIVVFSKYDEPRKQYLLTLIAHFPNKFHDFIETVIQDTDILDEGDIQTSIRNQFTLDTRSGSLGEGRASENALKFISYLSGIIKCELFKLRNDNTREEVENIQVRLRLYSKICCLFDQHACSMAVRPFNLHELSMIEGHYKSKGGISKYNNYKSTMQNVIDKHFPFFKKYKLSDRGLSTTSCNLHIPDPLRFEETLLPIDEE